MEVDLRRVALSVGREQFFAPQQGAYPVDQGLYRRGLRQITLHAESASHTDRMRIGARRHDGHRTVGQQLLQPEQVGAVLNVQPDHLGLKGIDTLEDLAAVKSVVVESVSRRGVSVLNADDPLTIRMARHAGGRVCWFSLRGGQETPGFVFKHMADGGMAVLYDAGAGMVTLHDRGETRPICEARAMPATMDGHVLFNVQNALAATAMAYSAGIQPEAIAQALSTFRSTYAQNPGRMNVHEAQDFRVILDYAHNPEALRALGRVVSAIKPHGAHSICLISIPGDRRESEIREMGEIGAEYFDHLVFRETPDNRGRPKGDVMRLLTEGALAAGCDPKRIHAIYEELDAAEHALRLAAPGDLVVLTPTRVEAVWDLIQGVQPDRLRAQKPSSEIILEPPHG